MLISIRLVLSVWNGLTSCIESASKANNGRVFDNSLTLMMNHCKLVGGNVSGNKDTLLVNVGVNW